MKTGTRWPDRRFWSVLCLALAMGCQGVSVWRVHSGPGLRSGAADDRPEAADRSLADPDPGGAGGLLAAANASRDAARGAERASPDVAARYELDAIADAAAALALLPTPTGAGQTPEFDPSREARHVYNAALEDLLRLTGGRKIHPDEGWRGRLAAIGVRVAGPGQGGGGQWEPARFDDLLFARDFVVRGMENVYRADGLGVPMIAVRGFEPNKRERRQGQDRFLMPREVYPVTAVLRPVPADGGDGLPFGSLEYRLELRDPLAARTIDLAGRDRPLASDLTTPLAFHLARSPLPVLQEVGLLDPEWVEALQGLYMLHPYRPGKIPIVFVHGLRSTPLAWLKVINEIWGDPALRERYQVWLYMYPSGKPIPSTAARLREDLDELRRVIDPRHADPQLDRMVVIGHSMGGLISKMLILESGDAIWRLFSNRPFEELQAPPDRRERLRQALFFSPNPSVARIVFIATPHRGSQMGDQLIGQITDMLIRLPRTLRSTYRTLIASNGREFFTPMLRDGIPTSIAELRFDNPLLTTMSRLPRRQDVPIHSIIGRKDPADPLEQSSDGVVPYISSHIDWARSELVVEGDHMCQDLPETIREIRRILTLHLEERAPALRR